MKGKNHDTAASNTWSNGVSDSFDAGVVYTRFACCHFNNENIEIKFFFCNTGSIGQTYCAQQL